LNNRHFHVLLPIGEQLPNKMQYQASDEGSLSDIKVAHYPPYKVFARPKSDAFVDLRLLVGLN
jgi:hypothetical protein